MLYVIAIIGMVGLYLPYIGYSDGNLSFLYFVGMAAAASAMWSVVDWKDNHGNFIPTVLFWWAVIPFWYVALFWYVTIENENLRVFIGILHLMSLWGITWVRESVQWLFWRRQRLKYIDECNDVGTLEREFLNVDYVAPYLKKRAAKRIGKLQK